MKKFITAMLAVVMALCLLAGCGNDPAPKSTDPTIQDSKPTGMLVLSTAASFSITYDSEGLVLNIDGNNDAGIELVDAYADYLGKACTTVVKELIAASSEAGYLSADVKNIVIKQSIRSQLPGTNFLESIASEVKAAAETAGSLAAVMLIDESKLDELGYINLETAKALLCNELGVEALDAYYGNETPDEGSYLCTVEVAGTQTSHNIDAFTGLITEATEDELLGDPEGEETYPVIENTEPNTEETIESDLAVDATLPDPTATEETEPSEPAPSEPEYIEETT